MTFSFNFISKTESSSVPEDLDSYETLCSLEKKKMGKGEALFTWIRGKDNRFPYQCFRQDEKRKIDSISLFHGRQKHHDEVSGGSVDHFVHRVKEESQSFQNEETDLVPGIYEGGLKVWECSIDMCRYFFRQNVVVKGHVLELGSGHGLPGIFILKQAIAKSRQNKVDCFVTFSDYNEFVIRDVTIPNVAINVREYCSSEFSSIKRKNQVEHLLSENTAFGWGDWLAMSDHLLPKIGSLFSSELSVPSAVPKDGLFDCILASETTYSEKSAFETAELLSRHMKPGLGVAYVCTKRYYFGVGGGTKCLCDALLKQKTHEFLIETLEVYDNGAGNIRELLLIKSVGPGS